MNQEKIGKYIQEKRKMLNLTQKELADKLNVSDKSVSKWERGINLPDISLYDDICAVFSISLVELLKGEDIEEAEKIEKIEEELKTSLMKNRKFDIISKILELVILVLFILMCIITTLNILYNAVNVISTENFVYFILTFICWVLLVIVNAKTNFKKIIMVLIYPIIFFILTFSLSVKGIENLINREGLEALEEDVYYDSEGNKIVSNYIFWYGLIHSYKFTYSIDEYHKYYEDYLEGKTDEEKKFYEKDKTELLEIEYPMPFNDITILFKITDDGKYQFWKFVNGYEMDELYWKYPSISLDDYYDYKLSYVKYNSVKVVGGSNYTIVYETTNNYVFDEFDKNGELLNKEVISKEVTNEEDVIKHAVCTFNNLNDKEVKYTYSKYHKLDSNNSIHDEYNDVIDCSK